MKSTRLRIIGLALLATLSTSIASADVVTLSPLREVTLIDDPSGGLANGAGEGFFAGRTGQGFQDRRRGLIAFDVSTAIPAGSIINTVTLRLEVTKTASPDAFSVSLHRASGTWGEGTSVGALGGARGAPASGQDATWIHRFHGPGPTWNTAGGDFAATASATSSVAQIGPYTWSSATLISDVQNWLDGTVPNDGWLLLADETVPRTAKQFGSRAAFDPSHAPELDIDFTAPGMSGACCLTDGTCVVSNSTLCAAAGGVYQGNGVNCTPDPCPPPTGSCCVADGSCLELTAADCGTMGGTYGGNGTDCSPNPCTVALTPFVDPLPIPAVAVPATGSAGGVAHYNIAMTQFTQKLHRDLPPTTVWGYGGTFPGPTIEASTDNPITVSWLNDLRDDMGVLRTEHFLPVDLCPHGPDHEGNNPRAVVHVHGAHVPAIYDGYPEFTQLPGQVAFYEYPNHQQPGTIWYHDHALGITRLNVMMGLAGFYLIRDAIEDALGLPDGMYEIPIVIQDRAFRMDGEFSYPAAWQDHFFGDTAVVNGMVWPFLNVDQGKYRFRLLNGSNSRTYNLTLSNGAPFVVIGTDGGLLPAPVTVNELSMAPAERFDVIIDFAGIAPGTEILLVNSAPAPFPGTPGVGVVPDVMKFIVSANAGDTDPVPTLLRPVETLRENQSVITREFELRKFPEACAGSIWKINDLVWDDITEFPQLGSTEIWSFVNRSGSMHPMHMHLVFFQVLDRQDFTIVQGEVVPTGARVAPAPEEQGWKDTVQVAPQSITRVIARFEDYEGLFAYHCHILEHEDHEMMRQFRTVAPPGDGYGYCEFNPGCGNEYGGAGCENSTGYGAQLQPFGSASVAADDLMLEAFDLPNGQPALLIGSTNSLPYGLPFGDGRWVLGSRDLLFSIDPATGMRTGRAIHSWKDSTPLGLSTGNDLGRASWGPGLCDIAARRAIGGLGQGCWDSGDTRFFQVLYRDPLGSCGNGFNLTNGVSVTFEP